MGWTPSQTLWTLAEGMAAVKQVRFKVHNKLQTKISISIIEIHLVQFISCLNHTLALNLTFTKDI